ncbi:unnamed protein product, partial [Prorocentrum cordatum]
EGFEWWTFPWPLQLRAATDAEIQEAEPIRARLRDCSGKSRQRRVQGSDLVRSAEDPTPSGDDFAEHADSAMHGDFRSEFPVAAKSMDTSKEIAAAQSIVDRMTTEGNFDIDHFA